MTPRRPRNLRPDEKELWDRVRHNTIPLRESVEKAVSNRISRTEQPKISSPVPQFRVGERSKSQVPGPAVRRSETAVVMDTKHFSRLKKGKLRPEARIDLHGMTLAQAHPALIGFILRAQQQSKRLVLVITGKGKPNEREWFFNNQTGILRHQVPHWLEEYPLRPLVLQVTQAHGRHGGDGAFYVYLRRNR